MTVVWLVDRNLLSDDRWIIMNKLMINVNKTLTNDKKCIIVKLTININFLTKGI